jgi:hypothetical protein
MLLYVLAVLFIFGRKCVGNLCFLKANCIPKFKVFPWRVDLIWRIISWEVGIVFKFIYICLIQWIHDCPHVVFSCFWQRKWSKHSQCTTMIQNTWLSTCCFLMFFAGEMIKTLTMHNNDTTPRHIGVGPAHWVPLQCALVLYHCCAQRVQGSLPFWQCWWFCLVGSILVAHTWTLRGFVF